MTKYFQTLRKLALLLLEDVYLFIDSPIEEVIRQILLKQLLQPFKKVHTIKIPATYSAIFVEVITRRVDSPKNEVTLYRALNTWLNSLYLQLESVFYNEETDCIFTYSYL